MGNFLLDRIEPLKHYFINVDPFDRKQRNNTGGMRQALAHLQNGGLLVILPRRGSFHMATRIARVQGQTVAAFDP